MIYPINFHSTLFSGINEGPLHSLQNSELSAFRLRLDSKESKDLIREWAMYLTHRGNFLHNNLSESFLINSFKGIVKRLYEVILSRLGIQIH